MSAKVAYGQAAINPEAKPISSLLFSPVLQDPKFIAAIAGVAVLYLIYIFLRPSNSASRRTGPATVLLVGPSDGGKTALFAKLTQDVYPQTQTSTTPSITSFALTDEDGRSKHIRLVDLPGHPRLKDEVTKYINEASAVIFVVDIVALVRNAVAVAEQIPPILSALANISSRQSLSTPAQFLLLAHKSDLLMRPPPSSSMCPPELSESAITTAKERLRSILTREMDRLKQARTAGGVGGRIEGMSKVAGGSGGGWFGRLFGSSSSGNEEGEGEDSEGLIWGGKGNFRWEDVDGVEVQWGVSGLGESKTGASKTVQGEGSGLSEIRRFLADM